MRNERIGKVTTPSEIMGEGWTDSEIIMWPGERIRWMLRSFRDFIEVFLYAPLPKNEDSLSTWTMLEFAYDAFETARIGKQWLMEKNEA